jgi:hypothetical protein
MKCICGYSHLPNNTLVLKSHIEDCLSDGPLSRVDKDPIVVWRNGEFQVVFEVGEDDAVFDVGYVKPESYKTKLEEIISAHAEKLETSQKKVEESEEVVGVFDKPAQKTLIFEDQTEEPSTPKSKRTRSR